MIRTLVVGAALWSGGSAVPGDSIAFVDGRIAALGVEADVRRAVGDIDTVLDADGALVHPGFADAHVHAAFAGLELRRCDLTAAASIEHVLAAISAFAAASDAPWILGGGWDMALFPGGLPTREQLDAVVADRPVFLFNADHHGAWVNSRALELAGITASTPDPVDGRIERRPDGAPAGVLHEGAVELVADILPPTTRAELTEAVLAGGAALNGFGVTAWQEALVGAYGGYPDVSPGYLDALASGRLRGTPTGALWVPRDVTLAGIPDLVAAFDAQRRVNAESGFTTTTAKLMLDGIAENRTAAMHEHYCGHDETGLSYFDPELTGALVRQLNVAGFAVHFHAIGDRAVTEALDAVAGVAPPDRRRNHIAHVQVVRPVDRPRFAELGVTVNAQALWANNEAQMTELTVPLLGETRAGWQYPFGSLHAAGAALAMGSDWPVTTPDPWQAIHVAVNRQTPGRPDEPPLTPDEALPLDVALDAYTRGSHELLGLTDAGVLAVGARADVVVADRDPRERPVEELHLTTVRDVFIGGERLG